MCKRAYLSRCIKICVEAFRAPLLTNLRIDDAKLSAADWEKIRSRCPQLESLQLPSRGALRAVNMHMWKPEDVLAWLGLSERGEQGVADWLLAFFE